MTNAIGNQKGLALVTTLLLIVLGFAVVAILLRLTARHAKLTGLQQDYTTALDAAKAGADDFIYNTQACLNNNPTAATNACTSPPPSFGTLNISGAANCLFTKLFNNTANWTGAATWGASCGTTLQQATATDANDVINYPDIRVPMGKYTVYIKIVNTYISNAVSANDPCFSSTGGGCYYYTVVSEAVDPAGVQAQVQFVYRYPRLF